VGSARQHRAALDVRRPPRGLPGALGAQRAHQVAWLPQPPARRAESIGGGGGGCGGRRPEAGSARRGASTQK